MSTVTKSQFRKINEKEYQKNLRKQEPTNGFGAEAQVNYEDSYLEKLPVNGGKGGRRQANIVLEGLSLTYLKKHFSRQGINTDKMIQTVSVLKNNISGFIKPLEETIKKALNPESIKTIVITKDKDLGFLNEIDAEKIDADLIINLNLLKSAEERLQSVEHFTKNKETKDNLQNLDVKVRFIRSRYGLKNERITEELINKAEILINSPSFKKQKEISIELMKVSMEYKKESNKLVKEIENEILFQVVKDYEEGMSPAQFQKIAGKVLTDLSKSTIDPLNLYSKDRRAKFIKEIKDNVAELIEKSKKD